jgi:broad specificity phosphatase PhoE
VKHGTPVLDAARPPREWLLSPRGESEAHRLAEELRPFVPYVVVASSEPKAERTAQLIASSVGQSVRVVDGIREIDRGVLPIVDAEAHRELNRPIFLEPTRAILGFEPANAALERFEHSIQAEIERVPEDNIVVVSHGTVISLFVGRYNALDSFVFWCGFQCGQHVALHMYSFRLVESRQGSDVSTA